MTEAKKPDPFKVRHTGGKKGAKRPSRLLRDMRNVYAHLEPPPGVTEAPGLATLRDFIKDDPKGFIAQMARLESDRQRAKTSPSGAGGEGKVVAGTPSDDGEMRVVDLIEKILGESAG